MSSGIGKLIEKIPYLDGGFRRRMTAGAIVVISLIFIFGSDISLTDLLGKVTTSPTFGILALLIIYAAGGLVEVLANLFATKLAGNMMWLIIAPAYMYEKHPRWARIPLRILAFYPGMLFRFPGECIEAMYGRSSYEWRSLEKRLYPDAKEYFRTLPDVVQHGLKNPFGNHSDLSWEYFCNNGSKEEIETTRKFRARSKDTLVIITSIIIPMIVMMPTIMEFVISFISSIIYNTVSILPNLVVSISSDLADSIFLGVFLFLLLVVPYMILFSGVLLVAYVLIVKQSIISVLELKALNNKKFPTP